MGLYCLPVTLSGVSRFKRVKLSNIWHFKWRRTHVQEPQSWQDILTTPYTHTHTHTHSHTHLYPSEIGSTPNKEFASWFFPLRVNIFFQKVYTTIMIGLPSLKFHVCAPVHDLFIDLFLYSQRWSCGTTPRRLRSARVPAFFSASWIPTATAQNRTNSRSRSVEGRWNRVLPSGHILLCNAALTSKQRLYHVTITLMERHDVSSTLFWRIYSMCPCTLFFLFLLKNIDCGYLLEWGEAVLTSTYHLCFEQKYEKYQIFLSENFPFSGCKIFNIVE